MKVKALTEIKKPVQTPVPDGQGGFTLKSTLLHLRPGEVAELDDALAAHLVGLGYASEDMSAPLLDAKG